MRGKQTRSILVAIAGLWLATAEIQATGEFGVALSYHLAHALISGTNPLKMFTDRNRLLYNVVADDFYSRNSTVKEIEEFQNKVFEAINPEITLFNPMFTQGGITLWAGLGKRTAKNFHYGVEFQLQAKALKAEIEKESREIFSEAGEGAPYLRNFISGSITCMPSIAFRKFFEASAVLRMGFAPKNNILGYVLFGTSIHANSYDDFNVEINPELKLIPTNDEFNTNESSKVKWQTNWVKSISKQVYKIPTGGSFYMSMNTGIGFDYFINKRFFIKVEYLYKFSFASHLRRSHEASLQEDSYNAYAIRYHDSEHCLLLGMGRTFS